MTSPRDPYLVLGLLPRATPQEVQRAFRRLVRQYHPDTSVGPGDPEELRAVLAAYAAVRRAEDGGGGGGGEGGGGADAAPAAVTVGRPATAYRPLRQASWARARQTGPPDPPISAGPVRWHRKPL